MKPIEPPPAASTTSLSAAKQEPGEELGEASIQKRLWELVGARSGLRIEGVAELPGTLEAQALGAMDSAGGTQGHTHEQRELDRLATGALSTAAHMLATTIQQLGISRYNISQPDGSPPHTPPRELPWTMQVEHVDANGGSASLDVLHPLLGDIALDVELSHSSVRVIATVANEYGARILQEGQAILAERLLRQGVTLAALDVLVRRKRKRKNSQPSRKRTRREER